MSSGLCKHDCYPKTCPQCFDEHVAGLPKCSPIADAITTLLFDFSRCGDIAADERRISVAKKIEALLILVLDDDKRAAWALKCQQIEDGEDVEP